MRSKLRPRCRQSKLLTTGPHFSDECLSQSPRRRQFRAPTDMRFSTCEGALRVNAGALVAAVCGVDFDLEDSESRLSEFVLDRPGPVDFTIDLSHGRVPRSAWRSSGIRSFRVDRRKRTVTLEMPGLTARFDLPGRRVAARLGGPWPRAIESLLRIAIQLFGLETRRSIVLHASCVERNGEGYVFMGRSEAGKTTAATLTNESGCGRLLREEISCVGRLGTPRSELFVHGLPIAEKNRLSSGPALARLSGLYWLRQGEVDCVEDLELVQQVKYVAAATAIAVRDPIMNGSSSLGPS